MTEYIRNASCELEPSVLSTMYFVGENVSPAVAREPRAWKLMTVASSLVQDIQASKVRDGIRCGTWMKNDDAGGQEELMLQ